MSTKKTNPANPYTVLPMEQLVPSPLYPFAGSREDNRDEWSRLRNSIKQNGILQPLLVRPMPGGWYEIICGHRRRQVCKEMGLSELPCLVWDMSDADAVACMVVDNERYRKQIRPSEMARAVAKMMALYAHQGVAGDQPGQRSNQLVADKLGITVNQVKCYVRVARAEEEVLTSLDREEMSLSVASGMVDIEPEIQQYIAMNQGKNNMQRLTVPNLNTLLQMQAKQPLTKEQVDAVLEKPIPPASTNITICFAKSELEQYIDLEKGINEIKKAILDKLARCEAEEEKLVAEGDGEAGLDKQKGEEYRCQAG